MLAAPLSPTKTESRLDLLVDQYGVDEVLRSFTEDEWNQILYDWEWNSRLGQTPPPGDWMTWVVQSGRGWGKTRMGAETVRGWAEAGEPYPMYIIGATAADVRDVMVEGESGILAKSPPWFMPAYEPSKRRLTWPNGVIAYTRSADKPDRLRGPQGSKAWCDEFCAWRYAEDAWDQINFMIRLGDPRILMTTTPRPIKLFREILKELDTRVQRGATRDNRHLSRKFLKRVYSKYGGTRLGRQELDGEVLDDNPGALWKMALIENARVKELPIELIRCGSGVDPSGGDDPENDEVGILFAGVAMCRCKGGDPELHAFVFDDRSARLSPDAWARAVADGHHEHGCDRVIAEKNFGGDLVESNLRTLGDANLPVWAVTASRGKKVRAEPVAALYEQGKVHHVGVFPKLEDELTQWNPLTDKRSPNRLDALVWVLTWLMLDLKAPRYVPMTPAQRARVRRRI